MTKLVEDDVLRDIQRWCDVRNTKQSKDIQKILKGRAPNRDKLAAVRAALAGRLNEPLALVRTIEDVLNG